MSTTTSPPDSSPTESTPRPSAERPHAGAWRSVGLLFAAIWIAGWPTTLSFVPTWMANYQEHGFFLGALALWLLWRDRDRLPRLGTEPVRELFAVLGLLSFGWLLAVVMDVRALHQLLLIVVATVWGLAVLGWGARVPVLTLGAIMALAVPVWGVLSPVLQRMTTIASGAMTRLAGIEAEVGVDWIAISSGTFLVEEGCSGINYLMGGLTLGAVYAQLFTRRWQTQARIVALAAAVSIVGNWIRVTALIFLGEATQMQSPYIEDHLWQGWAIFTLLMIPTYRLARRIEIRDARRFGDGVEEVTEPAPAPDAARIRAARLATTAALVGPFLYLAFGAIPRRGEPVRDTVIFDLDPAWAVTPEESGDAWTPDFRGFDQRADWELSVGDHTVDLARYYFLDQRQGEELIQYANVIAADSLLVSSRVFGPVGPDNRLVRESMFFADDGPRIAWHWYRVAGVETPFAANAKALEILAFFTRSQTAELVTMSARCAPDDCVEAALALRAAVSGPGLLESGG